MQRRPSASTHSQIAAWDFIQGFSNWRLWAFLGLHDIKQRYRRSSLGPLWLAMGLGATILGIGILYSQILKVDSKNFIPFLAISLLVWNFLASTITESTTTFLTGSNVITSTQIPYTSFVLRCLVRNLIVAAHCSIPVLLVFLYFKIPLHLVSLAAIPGLVLMIANMYWVSLIISVVCLRFRDIGQIVIYSTQLALFVTPIIWMPNQIRVGSPFIRFNPIYHLISLVRGPVFFGVFPVESWIVSIAMLMVGFVVSVVTLVRFRRSLVFWV